MTLPAPAFTTDQAYPFSTLNKQMAAQNGPWRSSRRRFLGDALFANLCAIRSARRATPGSPSR
jgi:hypothetical protein